MNHSFWCWHRPDVANGAARGPGTCAALTDLGNNVVAIDPTYGLNDEETTSTGACMAACTKVSTTNVAGSCCSCGGVKKVFKRSTFSTSVYLCQ